MRIRNWEKFQHYKDRCPPWIKVYKALLDDIDWYRLSGDASKLLVNCWLLASEDCCSEGKLPSPEEIAFRLRVPEKKIKTLLQELNKWLVVDASNVLADCKQDARPETETETETDEEKEIDKRDDPKRPEWFPLHLWKPFIQNRKFKKLQNTDLALTTICNSFRAGREAGYTIEAMVGEYVSSGWKRFDHTWMKSNPRGKDNGQHSNVLERLREEFEREQSADLDGDSNGHAGVGGSIQ